MKFLISFAFLLIANSSLAHKLNVGCLVEQKVDSQTGVIEQPGFSISGCLSRDAAELMCDNMEVVMSDRATPSIIFNKEDVVEIISTDKQFKFLAEKSQGGFAMKGQVKIEVDRISNTSKLDLYFTEHNFIFGYSGSATCNFLEN